MIISTLLHHQWLKTVRAPGYYKNVIVNIFLGLFGLYMAGALIALGFALPSALEKASPAFSAAELFNGAMLYSVFGILAMRYFIQPMNTLNLQVYQSLPVKRDTLVNYLLLKPLFNPINYSTLLFLIPFAIRATSATYSGWSAFRFVLIVVFLIWMNILLVQFLKRKFGSTPWGIVGILIFFALIVLLEYVKVFSLFNISITVFEFLISTSYGWLIVLTLPFMAFFVNKRFFAANYYPEKFERKTMQKRAQTRDFSFMERFGKIGEIISLELKLILRHKRTKSVLYMSILFLGYGLLFYPNPSLGKDTAFMFFVAMFITGMLMLMFGQWIFSWDSGHFDYLMTRNISTYTYIQANYYMLLAFNMLSFVATTPYFFFGKEVIYTHLAAFIYNIGVNINLYLLLGSFNHKKLDLSKGSAMNYQGTTYKNFLIVLPMMFFPMVFISILSAFSVAHFGLVILSIMGFIGIIFQRQLLKFAEKQFLKRKYAMSEGFRKKE